MCYKVLLTHAGLNSILSLKKEFHDKACFFFCSDVGIISLRTHETYVSSPALKVPCAPIILLSHFANLLNTVAKNAPKFSKIRSRLTKTKV